jgi:hypothetical protein
VSRIAPRMHRRATVVLSCATSSPHNVGPPQHPAAAPASAAPGSGASSAAAKPAIDFETTAPDRVALLPAIVRPSENRMFQAAAANAIAAARVKHGCATRTRVPRCVAVKRFGWSDGARYSAAGTLHRRVRTGASPADGCCGNECTAAGPVSDAGKLQAARLAVGAKRGQSSQPLAPQTDLVMGVPLGTVLDQWTTVWAAQRKQAWQQRNVGVGNDGIAR